MKMRKAFALVLAAIMLCAAFAGCSKTGTGDKQTGDASQRYLIGSYMPMTGNNATYYQLLVNAQDLAADYINANGGFNGANVEFVRYDTTSSNEEAAKIAQKLVQDDKVDAALPSPMSNEIKASASVLDEAHIPTMVVGTSTTLLSAENWDYVYRVALNTDYTIGNYFKIMKELGYTKAAIIFSQEEVAVSIRDAFVEQAPDNGVTITDIQSVESSDSDFTAAILNVIKSEPDIVIKMVVGSGNGTCTKQLRQLGWDGIIIEREIVGADALNIAGEAASEFYAFPSLYVVYDSIDDCDNEYMKSFLTAYQEKYGELPNYDWAYRAYDQVMTLWAAAKAAGSNDGEAVKAALDKLSVEGLGGTIDFTQDHEGYKDFDSFIYVDGKYVTFSKWLENGGYDAFLEKTGRDH